jgi:hypothetical protein
MMRDTLGNRLLSLSGAGLLVAAPTQMALEYGLAAKFGHLAAVPGLAMKVGTIALSAIFAIGAYPIIANGIEGHVYRHSGPPGPQ